MNDLLTLFIQCILLVDATIAASFAKYCIDIQDAAIATISTTVALLHFVAFAALCCGG